MIPYFAYNPYVRLLALFSIIVITIKHYRIGDKKLFFLVFFFILYTLIIHLIASDKAYTLRHLQLYIFIYLIYISSIVKNLSIKRKKEIILVILVFNLISLVGTYFGLLLDNHAARALSKSGEGAKELTEQGVGGYGTVYLNVILLPVLLYLKSKISNVKIKWLIWFNLLFAVIVIFKADFFIALILTIIQLLFFLSFKSSKMVKIIISSSIIFIFLFSASNLKYVEEVTGSLVEGTTYALKHKDIFSNLKGEQSQYGTVNSRSERYMRSAKIILSNPITGVLSYNDVGKHSNVLDVFAQFGAVFVLFFISLILYIPKRLLTQVITINKKYIKVFLGVTIIFGFLNNFAMQQGVAYILMSAAYGVTFKNVKL